MSAVFENIKSQHEEIMHRIEGAAKRAHRQVHDISLVAVSKVQPDERIQAMLKCGQTIYGENRVQEAQARWGERFSAHKKEIELRLIGPLQSNKIKDVIGLFDVVETLDREKLLKGFAKQRETGATLPRFYVQVNTGEESQKAGLSLKALPGFIKTMREDYDIEPEGLMCIPPQKEAASPHFWLLKNLASDLGLTKLSMGMSADFETAIEMGATSIRVGSALFGARNYS